MMPFLLRKTRNHKFIRTLIDILSNNLFIYVFNRSYFRLRSDRPNIPISYSHTVYTHMQLERIAFLSKTQV